MARLFIKNKRLSVLIAALLAVLFFTGTVYAETIKGKNIYTDRQTFKKGIVNDQKMTHGTSAEVFSTKDMSPRNWITNSELAIWSGETKWVGSGVTFDAVPDGWYLYSQSDFTSAERIDIPLATPGSSGGTIYPGYNHGMQIFVGDTDTGPGVTKYYAYPASGVSTEESWYSKFAGQTVVFGAWVKRPTDQSVDSGVTTNFIRPFVNRFYQYEESETSIEAYFTFGDYVEDSGWVLATMEYDVPSSATAFEVGFAMNPTITSAADSSGWDGSSGDSVFITAPFLLINPLHKKHVPVFGEVVWLKSGVSLEASEVSQLDSGASSWNIENISQGRIPADVAEIYVGVYGNMVPGTELQFRKTTTDYSGVTIASPWDAESDLTLPRKTAGTAWVQIDVPGDFDLYTTTAVSEFSITVFGARMR